MERPVEQSEGRALAPARQGSPFTQMPAAPDIRRRQGTQSARDLGERELLEMPRLERIDPAGE